MKYGWIWKIQYAIGQKHLKKRPTTPLKVQVQKTQAKPTKTQE
jgi:hypothetical protein